MKLNLIFFLFLASCDMGRRYEGSSSQTEYDSSVAIYRNVGAFTKKDSVVHTGMGAPYKTVGTFIKDTIPVKPKDVQFTWWTKGKMDSAHYTLTHGIYYDVMISSPKKGIVAYKKRDSAWVILDSAEAFKRLLWMVEQQSKMYR